MIEPARADNRPSAFAILPEGQREPDGVRLIGRLDRFDLALPVVSRLAVDVLVLSQALVDAERGWDAVRQLSIRKSAPAIWVVSDSPERNGHWGGLAARVLDPAGQVQATEAAATSRSKPLILVTGAKGGVGKTFVAANLAASLALSGQAVAAVDLDFESGDLAMRLGVEPAIDLLGGGHGPRLYSASGILGGSRGPAIDVWAAPARPELASLADEATVRQILELASSKSAVTVVDTASDPDADALYYAMEQATVLVLVTTLSPGALRQTRVLVELYKRLNFPIREKLLLVVNRARRRSVVPPGAVSELVGIEPCVSLPDVPGEAEAEAYFGRPAITARPPKRLRAGMQKLVGFTLPGLAMQPRIGGMRRSVPWSRRRGPAHPELPQRWS